MVKYRTPGQAGLVKKITGRTLKQNAHHKLNKKEKICNPHRLKELIAIAKKKKKMED